jgi:hypothetical protein
MYGGIKILVSGRSLSSWRWYGLSRASVVVIQGISDPATLEAMACREDLALACDLSLERVKLHQIALKLSQV